jgi:alkylation response protein AidB-like acyl-CoA dehydrogenase
MDFGLSEEQRLLQDTLRSYLRERVPVARVREIASAKDAADANAFWSELAELGAAGVLIAEEHGGSGLACFDAALVAEELGRAVAPAPYLGSAVLAPVALREAGTPEQRAEWLPQIAQGRVRVGAALTESYSRREGAQVRLERGRLSGKALLAIDVPGADLILVFAVPGSLALVRADARGLEIHRLTTIDQPRRVGELRLDGVEPAALLSACDDPPRALERTLDAGRAALAADLLGAAESMLEQAVAYAKQRSQFGRVIGSFQAVKHMCAEMAAELEPARSLCWYAAHAQDAVPADAPLMAAHAKAHLSDVGRRIADTATEVHGGIGFTDEQNLHLWFKRIGLDRELLGGPDLLRARAARLQGLGPAAGGDA